jgi:hypothetical protein
VKCDGNNNANGAMLIHHGIVNYTRHSRVLNKPFSNSEAAKLIAAKIEKGYMTTGSVYELDTEHKKPVAYYLINADNMLAQDAGDIYEWLNKWLPENDTV